MKILLSAPSIDDFIRLLRAWRLWLLAALIGSLAAAAFYYVSPPEYRARATVVVSFNMEKTWPDKPDNELFYYLERESRKVQDIAWADTTLQQVADQTGLTLAALRAGKLELSQPQDGGWHFYANDISSAQAQKLASIWAVAFATQVQRGIQTAVELNAMREALKTRPDNPEYLETIKKLEAKSLAITPEMQVSLAQTKDLPTSRKSSLGTYMLAGAGLTMALAALLILFFAPYWTSDGTSRSGRSADGKSS
jgi:hypothetical protein